MRHTPRLTAWIAAFAARQHALITYAQLCRVVTPGAITHRIKRGSLHRRYPTVYVVGQPKLSREGEWLAAALACDGVLSVRSCGVLHGVSRFHEEAIEVTTTRRVRLEGVRVHTVRRLDPRDITSHRGIPVTTIHRLLVDFTDEHTPHQIANVIHGPRSSGGSSSPPCATRWRGRTAGASWACSSGRSSCTAWGARARGAARRMRFCGSCAPSRW